MRSKLNSNTIPPAAYSQRSSRFIDRDFQMKFTRYIFIVSILSSLVFLIPTMYFINQNYDIFIGLADTFAPDIANHIASERFGFNIVFPVLFLANIAFWLIYTKNMTAKIVGPAKILRNHLRLLTRGDYTLPPVQLRDDDEFKDLIQTYNYFYSLMRVQNEKELSDLKKVQAKVGDPISQGLLQKIIHEREQRVS